LGSKINSGLYLFLKKTPIYIYYDNGIPMVCYSDRPDIGEQMPTSVLPEVVALVEAGLLKSEEVILWGGVKAHYVSEKTARDVVKNMTNKSDEIS